MTNADIVLQLRNYANELTQSHTNLYRVRAFRQAVTAVMGLDCEVVELVNHNSPGQAVIAGHAGAVQRALELCKAAGAKRAVILPMSVPAHSALMRPAAERFGAVLTAAPMQQPAIAYWSPVDGAAHATVEGIRGLLTCSWQARCGGLR